MLNLVKIKIHLKQNLLVKIGKKQELKNEKEVKEILDVIEKAKFIVKDIKKSEKKRSPAPPFTTSTMQQEASRKLRIYFKKDNVSCPRSL